MNGFVIGNRLALDRPNPYSIAEIMLWFTNIYLTPMMSNYVASVRSKYGI